MDSSRFVLVGLGLVIASAIISALLSRRRRNALSLVAQQIGFVYESDGSPFLADPPAVPLFNNGRHQTFGNCLSGRSAGTEVLLFDYKFDHEPELTVGPFAVTGGAKTGPRVYRQTVAAFRLPHLRAEFQLAPKGWKERVHVWLGDQDINFDDDRAFSTRYILQGPEEASIREIFTPVVRAHLATMFKNDWHVESGDGWIVIYVPDRTLRPGRMSAFLKDTSDLFALLAKA